MNHEYSSGGIIIKKENNIHYILLIKRQNGFGFPMGRVEKGETKEQAAEREIKEETGLYDLEIREYLGEINRKATNNKHEEVNKTVYLFKVDLKSDKKLETQEEESIWIKIEDAIDNFKYQEDSDFLKNLIK